MLYCKKFIENNKAVVKLFTLVVSLGLFQTNAMAEQCSKYVSNTSSSNSSVSTSESVPEYSSISAALEDRISGDVICFREGVYSHIKINDIDGGLNGISLQAEQDSLVEVKHTGYSGTGIYIANSKNIKVSGFTISGALFGIYAKGSSDLTITNNHISDVGQEGISIKSGISTQALNNFIVTNNVISDTGKGLSQYGEGIYIGDGNDNYNEVLRNVIIANNHINNVTNEAIDVKINVESIDIYSNTMVDTNLKFNGVITISTSERYGENSNITIRDNTIRGVINRMGYSSVGIAVGHGNATISNNFISESNTKFIGICLYTSFVNDQAKNVVIQDNNIVTDGRDIVQQCGKKSEFSADVSINEF
jgi:parallel beta-helix repeat protein